MNHPSLPKAPKRKRKLTIHGPEIPLLAGETEAHKKYLDIRKTKWKMSMEEVMARALYAKGCLTMVVNFKVVNEEGKFTPVKGQGILFKKIPSSGMLLRIIKRMREAAVKEIRGEQDANTL